MAKVMGVLSRSHSCLSSAGHVTVLLLNRKEAGFHGLC